MNSRHFDDRLILNKSSGEKCIYLLSAFEGSRFAYDLLNNIIMFICVTLEGRLYL